MKSKPTRSLLVALCAAVLLVPLGGTGLAGAVTSAFQPGNISHPGGADGTLGQEPGTFTAGQKIKLSANFPNRASGDLVTIYKESSAGSGNYVSTGRTDAANGYGNAYILDYEVTGDQKLFARSSEGLVTEIDALEPISTGACTTDGRFYTLPSTVGEGQSVELVANFPSSADGRNVTFLRKVGSGAFQSVGTDEANANGNAYLKNHEVADGSQTFYGLIDATNRCTEQLSVNPVPSSGVLDPIQLETDGHDARASFSPIVAGVTTQLQVKTIDGGTWKTISTDRQRESGYTYFQIPDPLEVEHEYRALANGITTNTVSFAAPLLDRDNGVPTVHFNSNDGESVNTRDNYFEGEFSIKSGTTDQNKNGSFETCPSVAPFEAGMKGRGNYSWTFDKKGFNLKFDDKEDLCGMGNSKKWALVANHYDRSLLRNSAANFVGEQMDFLEFTPKDVTVDLYVNGSYRGAYILIERVNLEGGRLDEEELKSDDDTAPFCFNPSHPDLSGTYLMEWDFRKGGFYNISAGDRGWVGLKEPEDEDYCGNMGRWINSYVDAADRDLFDGSPSDDDWLSRIDLASAVDYYIAMEFLKPVDGQMWASVYMYKPRGDKIHFGPLWDFDLAMGSATRAGNVVSPSGWYLRNPLNVSAKQTEVTWFNKLNENPQFRAAVEARWNQVDQDLNDVISYLRQQEALIDESAADNYSKWSHGSRISKYQVIKSSWGSDVDYLVDWLDKRWIWMNSQLDNND